MPPRPSRPACAESAARHARERFRVAVDPAVWADDALFLPETRAAWRRVTNLGYWDAVRVFDRDAGVYTFWDYQAGAWQRDHGFRIDHALLSPELADRLVACGVDKAHRGREKASDHAPIWVELAPATNGIAG